MANSHDARYLQASAREARKGAALMAMLQDGFNRRRNGEDVNWLRREGRGTAASAGAGRLSAGQRAQDASSRRPPLQGEGGRGGQGLLGAPVPGAQQHGGAVALSAGAGDLVVYGRWVYACLVVYGRWVYVCLVVYGRWVYVCGLVSRFLAAS
jgi:hypothetical protein